MATRGGSCRPLIDALQSQTGSLAYASDSGLRSAANSAPTPSDSCAFRVALPLLLSRRAADRLRRELPLPSLPIDVPSALAARMLGCAVLR